MDLIKGSIFSLKQMKIKFPNPLIIEIVLLFMIKKIEGSGKFERFHLFLSGLRIKNQDSSIIGSFSIISISNKTNQVKSIVK